MSVEESRENFRLWLVKFVDRFREQMKSLSSEEQSVASRTLDDFSSPCQFVTVWAKEPEFQILLFTHLGGVEDKTIEIFGPIENLRLVEYLESEILNSALITKIGKGKVESYIINALKQLQRFYDPLRGPVKSFIDGEARIGGSPYAVGWLILGNFTELNTEEKVSASIKNIASTAKPPITAPQPEKKVIVDGFGTYVYPPIWIGEPPIPKSLKEKMIDFPLLRHQFEIAIHGIYKNCPMIVTRDGYIAISEKDRSKALELLNEIMSTLLVLGISTYAVRESDLGSATFKGTSSSVAWSAMGSRALPFAETISMYPLPLIRTNVKEEKIAGAMKWADILTSDARLKTLLSLYLETNTHFMNTEYKQALVMGWVILEDFYLKDLWLSEITKVTSEKSRLSKLGSWDVDRQLETLSMSNVLTAYDYDLFMRIKDARNEVVHDGKDPKKEVVETCLKRVADVAQKYIRTRLGTVLSTL